MINEPSAPGRMLSTGSRGSTAASGSSGANLLARDRGKKCIAQAQL
jgi:hypothetical protein